LTTLSALGYKTPALFLLLFNKERTMLPRYLIGPIVLGFLALNLLGQALPLYTDYLWFQEVKFPSVFTTMLWYKIALGIAGGLIFALVVYLNVRLAARPRTDDVLTELEDPLAPTAW
jgi:uncharacterized membrane protein (UPF0182 family)